MKDLIHKTLEAYHSKENMLKINNNADVKLIIGMGRPLLSEIVGFSMKEYYMDPRICLESQLKWKLFWHNEIKDDTPLDLSVGIDYSTALEPSLFGLEVIFPERSDPTYGHPVITSYNDLKNLNEIDFFKSGIMPEVHQMYEGIGNLVKDDLRLYFTGWARGPWSIATMIRGFNDLFLDTVDNPEFVHQLMSKIVEDRISFEKQRCKFLDISPTNRDYKWKYVVYRDLSSSDQFEDEVDGSLFSVKTFNEFILPYSKKLAEYYGGINYYHSCGNLTHFMPKLAEMNIESLIQISPWTSISEAIKHLSQKVVLQRALHSINEVIMADENKMRSTIETIMKQTQGRKVEIWADALYEGGWNTFKQVKQLIKVFREVVSK